MIKHLILSVNFNQISAEEWAEAYDDCLKIVTNAGFARCEMQTILADHKALCIVPTEDDNGSWIANGDLYTGVNFDTVSMHRDIRAYCAEPDECANHDAVDYLIGNAEGEITPDFTSVFDCCCHHYYPYICMLAIMSLIANRFPKYAVIVGDFAPVDCIKAIDFVKKSTGIDVKIPMQYSYEELSNELKNRYKVAECYEKIWLICSLNSSAGNDFPIDLEALGLDDLDYGSLQNDNNKICDLALWQPGDDIAPKIEIKLCDFLREARTLGCSTMDKYNMESTALRVEFIINSTDKYPLPIEHLKTILSKADNVNYIVTYIGLLAYQYVEKYKYLVNALLRNTQLLDHVFELCKTHKEV